MRSRSLIAIASLSTLILAHPVAEPRQRRNPQAYSVVNVDGSGADGSAPTAAPTTIVQTVTAAAPNPPEATDTVTETQTTSLPALTTTLIITDDESSVSTLVITFTQPAPAAATQTFVSSSPAETVTKTVDSKPEGWKTSTAEATRTVVSTASIPSPTTTQYYDDGMWHTYYPIKNFDPYTSISTSPSSFPAVPSATGVSNLQSSFSTVILSVSSTGASSATPSVPTGYTNGTATTSGMMRPTSLSTMVTDTWWSVPSISTPASYPLASSTGL